MIKEIWQIELEKGNIWRAKEILRSIIKLRYDTNIYLAYGKILYDVQDYYEAGKYLFISGQDKDGKYAKAIHIFLERHKCSDINQLISLFPRKFIREDSKNYSINVQEYIGNKGYIKKVKNINNHLPIEYKNSLIYDILGIALVGLFFLIFFLGSKEIIQWLIDITMFLEVDKCLDAGGIWDYNQSRCDISY
jgi:hypothetical protein